MKKLALALTILTLILPAFCARVTVVLDKKITGSIEPIVSDGYSYISTDILPVLGEGRRYFASEKFKESMRVWGAQIVFSPENNYVVIDGTPYNMGLPTKLTKDGMLVPLIGFFESYAFATNRKAKLDGDTLRIYSGETENDKLIEEIEIQKPKTVATKSTEKKNDTKKPTVVIDAGHGGKDPGAVGPSGVREKDVTLQIAKELRDELQSRGFPTILTREGDKFTALSRRTQIANKAAADVFISIHCNASKRSESQGTQVFYLSPAKTDDARAAEALENQSLLLEDDPIVEKLDELQYIMADLMQTAHQRESSILAYTIENRIADSIKTVARVPAGAGFYVLYGAFMPSVLVECAFISNPEEEKKLVLPQNQKKIARSIADATTQFFENINSK
jgi:N-acetylmuramoyl-L-alanine amidase